MAIQLEHIQRTFQLLSLPLSALLQLLYCWDESVAAPAHDQPSKQRSRSCEHLCTSSAPSVRCWACTSLLLPAPDASAEPRAAVHPWELRLASAVTFLLPRLSVTPSLTVLPHRLLPTCPSNLLQSSYLLITSVPPFSFFQSIC